MTTKELFEAYFEGKKHEKDNIRNSTDRAEVYDMEEKLGKPLIEFTPDECIEMLKSFGGGKRFTLNTYSAWVSIYRSIFDFYSDNVELVRNPFNDKRFKHVDLLAKELGFHENKLTMKDVNAAIAKINAESDNIERSRYVECMMRLFLDGISSFEELVTIRPEQVNLGELTITMDNGVVIHLSERTAELLRFVEEMELMPCGKRKNYMVAWRNHYIKYPCRTTDIDDRDLRDVCRMVSRVLSQDVRKITEMNITYQTLYHLGLYEHLKRKFGEETLSQMLTGDGKRGKIVDDFQDAVVEYGVGKKSVYSIKRALAQYA